MTICQHRSETTVLPDDKQLLDVSQSVPTFGYHFRIHQSHPNTILGKLPTTGITDGMAQHKQTNNTQLDLMETGINNGSTFRM